jgi:hypothetical protein
MTMHACTCDIYPTHAVQIQTNATMQMQSPYPKFNNACLAQSSQKNNPQNSRQSLPLLFLKNSNSKFLQQYQKLSQNIFK